MDIKGKTIWQIAAGNGEDTNYAELCLLEDAIVVGPGRYGAWPDCERPMRVNGWTGMKVGIIKRFAEDISPGDIIVLRVDTDKIYGVGEVVGKYGHSEIFSNVQGWDLQHFRRVRWLWHKNGKPKMFHPHTLKFGSSVQYLISEEVRYWLEALDIPSAAYTRPLMAL